MTNFNPPLIYNEFTQRGSKTIANVVNVHLKFKAEWLSNLMTKYLEPDEFLKVSGDDSCKRKVMELLKAKGFELRLYPSGREELYKANEKLGEFPALEFKPKLSTYKDDFNFTI